jgi:hypothetical protein
VHRFLLFKPHAPVDAAIAAGSGWFTVPDRTVRFPYGLRHPLLRFSEANVLAYLRAPLTLMRGELDRLADPDLRRTAGARAQGANRHERAGHALERARRLSPACRWRIVDVPGIGHDWAAMAGATQTLSLLERDRQPLQAHV